jgi:diacylglycerol kinase (ATP)
VDKVKTFIKKRIKSFGYAFQGIGNFIRKEPNAWIHCTAVVVVTSLGLYYGISATEWCIVILCFGLVLMAEAFNTAIERLVDLVSPDFHPLAGTIKDVAAGAVLLGAIAAAIVGCIIFIPYIFD